MSKPPCFACGVVILLLIGSVLIGFFVITVPPMIANAGIHP